MRPDANIPRPLLVIALLLMAVPAAIAQPAPQVDPAVPTQTIPSGQILGVFGGHVQDAAGSDAGRVWDVLVDDDGRPRAAVIDYGGTLGIGRRKVAVAWQELHFAPDDPTHPIRLALTRQQLGAIPEFKYGSGPTTLGDGR